MQQRHTLGSRRSLAWRVHPCPSVQAARCRRSQVTSCTAASRPVPPVPAVSASGLPSFSFCVTAKQAAAKLRLDSYLVAQISAELAAVPASAQDVSRAKVVSSIAAGLVLVNGRPATKASMQLKAGDGVSCELPPPPPMQAVPEDIPLDIKYEDDHVMVINKPAGMVMHIAPGHYSGTLVNALLHHCALPPLELAPTEPGGIASGAAAAGGEGQGEEDGGLLDGDGEEEEEEEEVEEERGWEAASGSERGGEAGGSSSSSDASTSPFSVSGGGSSGGILRPGIVHRIDKGTSGLLVVAKTETALRRLQAQFKARTVDRLYVSITIGCPGQQRGRVETNIVRDPRDRKRMAAAAYGSGRGRTAASGFAVQSPLAGGGAALVQWKLDTGRTHQIRVHAKHMGHPLLSDDTYGGAGPAAVAAAAKGGFPADQVRACMEQLGRPALHALTLAFDHPVSGERLSFEQPPPEDFARAVQQLRRGQS